MDGFRNALERPLTYVLLLLVLGLAVGRSGLVKDDVGGDQTAAAGEVGVVTDNPTRVSANNATGASADNATGASADNATGASADNATGVSAEGEIAVASNNVAPAAANRFELEIASGAERYRFKIEMAVTPAQRSLGLMNRRELAPDAGMLFDYGRPRYVSFWMKNTLIPLDMIFIRKDGSIARIAKRTVPLSLEAVPSGEPVLAVLEVIGGTTDRLGIAPGDTIIHPIFGNTD